LPHPSYDLNQDGSVSFKEYAIAKRFDIDKDGILNEQEKKECLKQLKEGYEERLFWNENARVVQTGRWLIQFYLHNICDL
jgi:hypothetical protein